MPTESGWPPAPAPEMRPAALPFLAIKKISVHYRPRPVVGIIAPWNYPVANALMDAIGALSGQERVDAYNAAPGARG